MNTGSNRIPTAQTSSGLRWSIYALLIAIGVGHALGRILAVNSVDLSRLESQRVEARMAEFAAVIDAQSLDESQRAERMAKQRTRLERQLRLQRPFLSGNDRSRWMAVRALVEHGTFEIDRILQEPTWDSIDIVRHTGRDGELHFYSSKPPLLVVLLALPYWVLVATSGMTLGTHPYEVGRVLLVLVNLLPLAVMWLLIADLVERLARTDWARVAIVAIAVFATQLSTFVVVINNHLTAAVLVTTVLWALVRIRSSTRPAAGLFVLAGLSTALATACELPALSLVALLGLMLLVTCPRLTLTAYLPALLVVAAAFFVTNYAAHQSLRPPYMHRGEGDDWYRYEYVDSRGQTRQSYWMNRQGIDRGEASRWTYAMHVLVGHHGVFSLTPLWLLSLAGIAMWLGRGGRLEWELALVAALLTVVCLVFYIALRPIEDRNYGGMTCGFRWLYWLIPLWLITLCPVLDRLGRKRSGQAMVLALTAFSMIAVSYSTWNPWSQPWIWNWLRYCGFKLL